MKIYNSRTKKNENIPSDISHILIHDRSTASQDYTHAECAIGNLRRAAIQRYLLFKGYKVTFTGSGSESTGEIFEVGYGEVTIDGEKIHESQHNSATVDDMAEWYGDDLLTWVVLRHHYRTSIDLNDKLFRDNLNALRDFYIEVTPSVMKATLERPNMADSKIKALFKEFEVEMDNDFNIPKVLILLSHYLKEIIALKAQGKKAASRRLEEAVVYIGRLLGLFRSQTLLELTNAMLKFQQQVLKTPELVATGDIDKLVEDREKARESKEFAKADHICNLLKLHGVVIVDSVNKNKWKFIAS